MRKSGTRERILEISAGLFARKGFTGTSIADIARELGTTTAALYYHFPSKGDILAGLLAEPLKAYARIIEDLGTVGPSPEAILASFIDLAAESRELAQMIDRDPAVIELIDQHLPQSSQEMTAAIIKALSGPDADRAAVIRANAALGVVKGATPAALGDGGFTAEDRAEILAAALRALDEPSLNAR
jgi:AcrR family transcriptional regulator